MNLATKESLEQADILFNKHNVAYARSQRVLNSWLHPKTSDESSAVPRDEDDDLQAEEELPGIGSTDNKDDEGSLSAALKRRQLASNEKLLEQLMGKKAAQARIQSQRANKASATLGAPKPQEGPTKRPKPDEDSDDEEVGRAGAFKSRKMKSNRGKSGNPEVAWSEDALAGDGASGAMEDVDIEATRDSEPDERPQKRKPTSYLDEILAQKAGKKGKKKAGKGNPES